MENQSEFSVKPAIEKQPFQDAPTRAFFAKWCEVNDSIEPKYVSRDEWNKDSILAKEKNEDGKQLLSIPKDLKLWEMVDVIESVDKDTFAHNPKKRQDKRKELNDLGETFVNAGIYLAQRREGIQEGKQTAETTAKDLYRYGNALRTGDYGEQTPITDIADNVLSSKQIEEIDTWFGVDKLARFKQQDPEQTRQEMLTQFFKVTEQAKDSESHRKVLEKVHQKYLEKPINRPEQELQETIFRRGVEKIANELGKEGWRDEVIENFDQMGVDLRGKEENLREVLEIPRLKTELALVRETGDVAKISEKEREIAGKIQDGVSRLPYEVIDGTFPSHTVERQYINCVGSSLLGGSLLNEVGIKYLVGSLPSHSLTFLVTSDNKVYWQDFTPTSSLTFEIQDEKLRPVHEGDKTITTKDIAEYADNPSEDGLVLSLDLSVNGKREQWVISASSPEQGHVAQVMNNTGFVLAEEGKHKEAIAVLERSLSFDKNISAAHSYLSESYLQLGEPEKALDEANKTIALNPKFEIAYQHRDKALRKLGRTDEAIRSLKEAVQIFPGHDRWYTSLIGSLRESGKNEEALAYAEKAIEVNPQNSEHLRNKGIILNELNRPEEAVVALRQAVAIDAEDIFAQIELSNTLMKLGKGEEGVVSMMGKKKLTSW